METTQILVAGIFDNLRRVFQVVNEHSKKAEHETGLTGPQLWAIKVLAECSPIKVSDLAGPAGPDLPPAHPALTEHITDQQHSSLRMPYFLILR